MLVAFASLLLVPTDALARKKCKNFCSVITQTLRVCGNAVIGGDLTVNGTINNTTLNDTINNIIIDIDALQSDFLFAFSDEAQPYAAPTVFPAFQKITFNNTGPLDGWTVDAAGNFTAPATGLYLVSYSAGIGDVAPLDVLASANIAAFFGPLAAETFVDGSDSSVQITAAIETIQNASSTFLLNAVAGQNLFFGFLTDALLGTVQLEATNLTADTTTTIAVTITRIN